VSVRSFVKWLVWGWLFLTLVSCASPAPETPLTPSLTLASAFSPALPSPLSTPVPPTPTPTAERLSALAAVPSAPSPTATAPAGPTLTPPLIIEHTVQPGETLLGLAMRYSVPMAAIQLQNQLGEETAVWAGQALAIPPAIGWEGASPYWLAHLVKQGETLSGIAAFYGLDVTTLNSVNGLSDADLLAVGQSLIVPLEAPVKVVVIEPQPTQPPTHTASTLSSVMAPLPSPAPIPAGPLPGGIAAWPHELGRLINEIRSAHGLPPFVYNDTLARAAQLHAEDCRQRGWCSHTGSDGSDTGTRILRAGYQATGTAECWVQALLPQDAVDVWMDETPPNDSHRRTLFSAWVTEIGIGIVSTDWGYYFIADFGRP